MSRQNASFIRLIQIATCESVTLMCQMKLETNRILIRIQLTFRIQWWELFCAHNHKALHEPNELESEFVSSTYWELFDSIILWVVYVCVFFASFQKHRIIVYMQRKIDRNRKEFRIELWILKDIYIYMIWVTMWISKNRFDTMSKKTAEWESNENNPTLTLFIEAKIIFLAVAAVAQPIQHIWSFPLQYDGGRTNIKYTIACNNYKWNNFLRRKQQQNRHFYFCRHYICLYLCIFLLLIFQQNYVGLYCHCYADHMSFVVLVCEVAFESVIVQWASRFWVLGWFVVTRKRQTKKRIFLQHQLADWLTYTILCCVYVCIYTIPHFYHTHNIN